MRAGAGGRSALGNMALHKVVGDRTTRASDVYASALSGHGLPRRTMADGPTDPYTVYELLRDELLLDGNARQNLATFCTTSEEPAGPPPDGRSASTRT